MNRQKNIKKAIETQRRKLDRMAGQVRDLCLLLEEARRMDRLIEVYEARKTTACIRKNA